MESFMKIKDRKLKKDLMQQLMECKQTTSHVITVLRSLTSLDNLNNSVIAQLNDLAYKGIQKTGLQKMVDKRAIANEENYEKIENEVKDIASKIDFKKIEDTHKSIIEEVGCCPLS